MKGKKMKVELEHAAIVEAVQMWVDKYLHCTKVISIDKIQRGKGTYDKKEIFTVEMEVEDNETMDIDPSPPSM